MAILSADQKVRIALENILKVPEVLAALKDGHDDTFCPCPLCYARDALEES